MSNELIAYFITLALLVILVIGFAHRAFWEYPKLGARTMGLLMLSMSIWAAGYLLEISSPSFETKVTTRKFLYLGMTTSAPLWLGFALRYTGLSRW